MKVELRAAREQDIGAIETMRGRLFAHHESALNSGRDRSALMSLTAAPAYGRVWLIDREATIAGYAIVTFCFSIEFGGPFALLDEFYVDPPFRGRGVGGAVLNQIEAQLRSVGILAIRLEVERSNVDAERLYRRAGFEAHDRNLMTKWLHV